MYNSMKRVGKAKNYNGALGAVYLRSVEFRILSVMKMKNLSSASSAKRGRKPRLTVCM